MEYLSGRNLVTLMEEVGHLEEEEAKPIFKQLASGVHYLHQRRIAHRDIKLENILLGEGGKVKLCDFGLATQLEEGQMLQELWGSMPYWAPEILARRQYDGMAGDMWSMGVVLYALVTGKFPYRGSTLKEMYNHIITTRCPIPHHLSTRCSNIIARLLKVNVQFRLTSSQLMEQQWLGHMEEHVMPPAKEILPKVVETMCNIGYTCEQVVACLKHPKLDNITATMKIIKFHLSSGHSNLQTSHADPMKRHSKAALLIKRISSVSLCAYTCPEVMNYINPATGDTAANSISEDSLSQKTDPEDYTLPDNNINPATGDTAANRISEDGLSQKTVPEDNSLPDNNINPATGDTTVNKISEDGLSQKTDPEVYSLPANNINPATGDTAANRISEDGLSQKTVPEDDSLPDNSINPATGDTAPDRMSEDGLSQKTDPEDYSLPANNINPATGDTAANRISEDGLSQKTVPEDDSLPDNTINPATGDTAPDRMSEDGLSQKTDPEDYTLPDNNINPATGDTATNRISENGLSQKTVPEDDSLPDNTINPATGDTAADRMSEDGLSQKTDPEDYTLPANTINPATRDTAVNVISPDSPPENFSPPEPPLNGKNSGSGSILFTEEEQPVMPSDQSQDVPTASGTRPLRGWKLMKKRISHAFRALCCCCLPTHGGETEVA
ncbi:MAP/microtubule affinity-regulating kinase 3 [Lemmus lemmus]